jgi:hypothetical protein
VIGNAMGNEVASDRDVATLPSALKLDSLNFKNTNDWQCNGQ